MATKQINIRLSESDDAAIIIIQDDVKKRTGAEIAKCEAARIAIRERARQLTEAVRNESN